MREIKMIENTQEKTIKQVLNYDAMFNKILLETSEGIKETIELKQRAIDIIEIFSISIKTKTKNQGEIVIDTLGNVWFNPIGRRLIYHTELRKKLFTLYTEPKVGILKLYIDCSFLIEKDLTYNEKLVNYDLVYSEEILVNLLKQLAESKDFAFLLDTVSKL